MSLRVTQLKIMHSYCLKNKWHFTQFIIFAMLPVLAFAWLGAITTVALNIYCLKTTSKMFELHKIAYKMRHNFFLHVILNPEHDSSHLLTVRTRNLQSVWCINIYLLLNLSRFMNKWVCAKTAYIVHVDIL